MDYESFYNSYEENTDKIKYKIFSDRKIFKPGQKIQFKVISYIAEIDKNEILANNNFTVYLIDRNDNLIAEQILKPNI